MHFEDLTFPPQKELNFTIPNTRVLFIILRASPGLNVPIHITRDAFVIVKQSYFVSGSKNHSSSKQIKQFFIATVVSALVKEELLFHQTESCFEQHWHKRHCWWKEKLLWEVGEKEPVQTRVQTSACTRSAHSISALVCVPYKHSLVEVSCMRGGLLWRLGCAMVGVGYYGGYKRWGCIKLPFVYK